MGRLYLVLNDGGGQLELLIERTHLPEPRVIAISVSEKTQDVAEERNGGRDKCRLSGISLDHEQPIYQEGRRCDPQKQ